MSRRTTGALPARPNLVRRAARAQHDLENRAAHVLGDPRAAAREWAPLAARLGLDVSHDPYWPELADRLSSLRREGLDVTSMLTAAAQEKPLPDEQGAAALWWRLSRHLTPAAVTATGGSGARATNDAVVLAPTWNEAHDLESRLEKLLTESI